MAKRRRSAKREGLLKLDLGCGQRRHPGFLGVDLVALPDVDLTQDLCAFPWPWETESVGEVVCSHYFEHVPGRLRGAWMDELYRVLAPKATALIIVPYWASTRSVQDFTHEWPPLCEASFLYFNAGWRRSNQLTHGAYDLACDFDFTYGYDLPVEWASRHEEPRAFGVAHYLGVVQDLHVVLTKRG